MEKQYITTTKQDEQQIVRNSKLSNTKKLDKNQMFPQKEVDAWLEANKKMFENLHELYGERLVYTRSTETSVQKGRGDLNQEGDFKFNCVDSIINTYMPDPMNKSTWMNSIAKEVCGRKLRQIDVIIMDHIYDIFGSDTLKYYNKFRRNNPKKIYINFVAFINETPSSTTKETVYKDKYTNQKTSRPVKNSNSKILCARYIELLLNKNTFKVFNPNGNYEIPQPILDLANEILIEANESLSEDQQNQFGLSLSMSYKLHS